MPLVSIVVPCYNEQRTIRLLLDAIYHQTYPRSQMEVVLADGMSSDETRAEVAAFQQKHPDLLLRVVDNPQRNIPSGLNRAIEAAQGDVFVRLDAHSMPERSYVERCVTALEAGMGDNVGGVWDIQPGAESWLARSIALAAAHPLGVGDALYRYTDRAGVVDTVPFGAFTRDTLKRIGGFDENLLTNEDYEFNTRLRQSGGRIWLDPAIRSTYFSRATLGALAKQYFRYGYWKLRMLRRYPDTLRWRQALPPLFVLSLIILALVAVWYVLARWLLALEILLYITTLVAGTAPAAIRNVEPRFILGLPAAIMTMHINWGAGFLWSMIDPRRR